MIPNTMMLAVIAGLEAQQRRQAGPPGAAACRVARLAKEAKAKRSSGTARAAERSSGTARKGKGRAKRPAKEA